MSTEPLLIDAKALAKLLSCSIRSIWRLKSSGKIPTPVRVGASVRWPTETVREWIAMGCPDRATFEATGHNSQRRAAS